MIALSEVILLVGRTYLPGWIAELGRIAAGASLKPRRSVASARSEWNRGFDPKPFLVTRIDLRDADSGERGRWFRLIADSDSD
jgi:hypothetical protein